MTLGRARVVVAFTLLGTGCLTGKLPHVGRDAPREHVLRTGPFVFTTDFELARRDPLVDDLLGLRQAIHETLFLPEGNGLVRIVVFDSQQGYDEFVRTNFPELPSRRAFFVQQAQGEMVVIAAQGDRLRGDLRHEATHALLHRSMMSVPLWLDEGFAEYFEAGPEGLNSRHVARLDVDAQRGWKPDLRRLERMRDLWQMNASDYRESWLWVHFASCQSSQTRRELLTYVTNLAHGEPDSLADRLERVDPHYVEACLAHLDDLAGNLANKTLPEEGENYHVGSSIPILPAGDVIRSFLPRRPSLVGTDSASPDR
ncbi:hypothetical protein Pan216_02840 [Planctomycetes bacterium Pan216]|uniref:DUF1570 domain-containing protein n=1 Tax=Kolteria novifilia TaxID=2527975 RepID=A0A518AXK1_9BACT|nr:hypothetical protein Pan216_02840 [Planctomycetes bacterium Pan216]